MTRTQTELLFKGKILDLTLLGKELLSNIIQSITVSKHQF